MIIEKNADLVKIAKDFLDTVSPQIFVFLHGKMGAGKTTFVRECMEILGTSDNVSSPTFGLINEYSTAKGLVYHLDLHHLKIRDKFILDEIDNISDRHFLTFIEWPEIIKENFDYRFVDCFFKN